MLACVSPRLLQDESAQGLCRRARRPRVLQGVAELRGWRQEEARAVQVASVWSAHSTPAVLLMS